MAKKPATAPKPAPKPKPTPVQSEERKALLSTLRNRFAEGKAGVDETALKKPKPTTPKKWTAKKPELSEDEKRVKDAAEAVRQNLAAKRAAPAPEQPVSRKAAKKEKVAERPKTSPPARKARPVAKPEAAVNLR